MTTALAVITVFVLTFGTAYFVAQEFAFVSADRVELSRRAAAGDKRAASAIRVMERLSFMLSAAQVGITVTGLLVGFIAEPAFVDLIDPALSGLGVPDAAVSGIAIATGFVLATAVQMLLGELFPKNVALATPERLAMLLAPSTHVYLAISGPVVRIFDGSAARLLRKIGIEPVEELHHGATLEELGHVIDESQQHGSLSPHMSRLLSRALTFSEHIAGEVMVPRPDVQGVSRSAPVSDVIELITEHGHSHYPVLGETTDDVIGVVGVRELMFVREWDLSTTPVGDLVRPALLVPDTLALPVLVQRIHDAGDEFACVVDEYGGLAGIVTLEDISEELLGEITDETDQQQVLISRQGEWWRMDAGLRVDQAVEHTGLRLPESDDYDTVAGMIVAASGSFPAPGERLTVPVSPDDPARLVDVEVLTVARHVPEFVLVKEHVQVPDEHVAEAGSEP